MSRDALTMRSRRSWSSSNSLRKASNMGMKGDARSAGAASSSEESLGSVIVRLVAHTHLNVPGLY